MVPVYYVPLLSPVHRTDAGIACVNRAADLGITTPSSCVLLTDEFRVTIKDGQITEVSQNEV